MVGHRRGLPFCDVRYTYWLGNHCSLPSNLFPCHQSISIYVARVCHVVRPCQPRTLFAYGILRISTANPKHNGTTISETIRNFRMVGMPTGRNRTLKAINTV